VVNGLIQELIEKGIISARTQQWITVDDYRKQNDNVIANHLNRLERAKGGNTVDRGKLLDATLGGEWGWHRYRRVLPDDRLAQSVQQGNYSETNFKQRLHMKSQERGAHHTRYEFDPNNPMDQGWDNDPAWEPRLLWKQERPNVMLIFQAAAGHVKLSDLENVWSRRVLRGEVGPIDSTDPLRDEMQSLSQDERNRAQFLTANLSLDAEHVFDYALEQTLGFVNEAYAPTIDRQAGVDDVALMKSLQKGAPEVIVEQYLSQPQGPVDAAPAAPEAVELQRWNVVPRQIVKLSTNDELERRQELMRTTFPWMAWNNRPFISAEELLQVPATSASLLLRFFTVLTSESNGKNPYNGTIVDDGANNSTAERYARQQGVFSHLLNFFNTAARPAGTFPLPATPGQLEPFSGAPHINRLLEFVQEPSADDGTDTLL
jgi:hypothetical protein